MGQENKKEGKDLRTKKGKKEDVRERDLEKKE